MRKLTQNAGNRHIMCGTIMRKKTDNENCDKNVLSYILSSLVCQHFFLFFLFFSCVLVTSVCQKTFHGFLQFHSPPNGGNDVSPQPQDPAVGFTPRFVAVN